MDQRLRDTLIIQHQRYLDTHEAPKINRNAVVHGDLNPMNILMGNGTPLFIDWETAGANHPFMDIATFCIFMNIPRSRLGGILESYQTKVEKDDMKCLEHFIRLAYLAYGTFFCASSSLAKDVTFLPKLPDAPDMDLCFQMLQRGEIDLANPKDQILFGFSMIRKAHSG